MRTTGNLDAETYLSALCRRHADAMLTVRDEDEKQVTTGGTRVLAYPAAHLAVADGESDYAFVYLNLRIHLDRNGASWDLTSYARRDRAMHRQLDELLQHRRLRHRGVGFMADKS